MPLNVSFKAVLLDGSGQVLLGRNPRDEWELLGGRPDPGDASPQETLRRELREEAAIDIDVGSIIDSWIYDLGLLGKVCIVTYRATVSEHSTLEVSEEHSDLRWFTVDEALTVTMPTGYKASITAATTP